MNKIVRIFLDADMRCQHDGLADMARKKNIDIRQLPFGEHVFFVNKAKNRLKMYSSGNVIGYLRLYKGVLDMRALARIPMVYGSTVELKYNKSLKAVLKANFRH